MSDAATSARAFRRALEDAFAEERVPFAHGTAVLCPSLRDVYDANFLRAESPASVDELAAAADELLDRCFHRKVVVDEGGDALAPRFRERGYVVTPHLVMAHRREPDRRAATSSVREVPFERLAPVRADNSPAEYTEAVREGLNEAKRRVIRSSDVRFFAAEVDGEVAAYCELRSDGRTAQIEDVNTLEPFRGRGLGRAVVQHAVDEGRRTHELVFLEALEEDWPRHLYAKLGFDVVDRRHLFLRPAHPFTALVVRTPRLELRLATRAELRALAAVARAGIHPADEMPFGVAWTDNAASPSFAEDFVAFHEVQLRDSTPRDWNLNLVAFLDRRPVGSQTLHGHDFAATRTVGTGSWLGAPWQGNGLGTEMRAAALELAFAGLGAGAATSGAVAGNAKSLGVSRKLGYVETGVSTVSPRGTPVAHHDVRRDRDGWRSPVPVQIEGLAPLLPLLGAAA